MTRSTAHLRAILPIAPEVADHLERIGLPEVLFGGRFRLDDDLQVVRRPDGSPLLRLGVVMLATLLCVDPRTGRVVEIWNESWSSQARVDELPWRETFTNSTLAQFVQTACEVVERLPYYHRDSELAERHRVAQELGAIIDSIDPPAMAVGLLWSTFVDDVAIGDFAAEDLE